MSIGQLSDGWLFLDQFLINEKTYKIFEVKPKRLFESKYFRIRIVDSAGIPEKVPTEFRHFLECCHWILLKSNGKIHSEGHYQSIREIKKKESHG